MEYLNKGYKDGAYALCRNEKFNQKSTETGLRFQRYCGKRLGKTGCPRQCAKCRGCRAKGQHFCVRAASRSSYSEVAVANADDVDADDADEAVADDNDANADFAELKNLESKFANAVNALDEELQLHADGWMHYSM